MTKRFLALSLGILTSISVSASVITYDNRTTNAGVDKTDYQSSWNAQSTEVRSRDLTTFTKVLPQRPDRKHAQHSHLNISFDVSQEKAGQNWWFQFSPDAGLGGEMYFDGNLVERNTTDLWWGYRWSRGSELLEAVIDGLDSGTHTLDLFWAEGCCNGGQSGRFSVDEGATWLAVSTDNLNAVGVPEPGTLALLGLGLVGLVFSRRQQKS